MKRLLVIAFLASSCATHGPYVMNLKYDKNKKLSYKECELYINGFWGYSESKNCKDVTLE